jgi:hypothetical protein
MYGNGVMTGSTGITIKKDKTPIRRADRRENGVSFGAAAGIMTPMPVDPLIGVIPHQDVVVRISVFEL